MKKRIVCALFLCSMLGTTQAQTDVTADFFANPSFEILKTADNTADVQVKTSLENGLFGWEVASMSNYQVESEESGSATGFPADGSGKIKSSDGTYYYFNRQGWGNKDSELKTTATQELPAGNYYVTINYKAADYSNQNNANNNGTTIGIRVNDSDAAILGENTAVRRAYSITNDGSNPGNDAYMVNAAWSTLGAMFTVTEPTKVTVALQQNMRNSGRSDIAYDNLRLYRIENISEESPLDVSGLISASTDYAMGGWTTDGENTFQVNTWSTEGNSDGSGMTTPFIQNWVGRENKLGNATLKYTLTNLIHGTYEVSGLIRVLNEAGGSAPAGAVFFANEGQTDACAGSACTNGVYGTYSVKATVSTDGTLQFGIRITDANFNWLSLKNFSIRYLGEAGMDALKKVLTDKITEAENRKADSPAAIAALLQQAIDSGKAVENNEQSINNAIGMLNDAIAKAENIMPATQEVKAVITSSLEYEAHSTATDRTRNTLNKAIQEARNNMDKATTAEEMYTIAQNLKKANETYILNALPQEGYPFDYTFMIADASGSINGWNKNVSEGNIQNFVYKKSGEKNNGDLKADGFIEAWNGSSYTATISYTKTGLPNGKYGISAYAFTTVGGTTAFTANNTESALDNTTALFTHAIINEVTVTDGTLTFGLNSTGATWIGIGNVHLQYLSGSLEDAKNTLKESIDEAKTTVETLSVGADVFQIPTSAAEVLRAAINEASGTYENNSEIIPVKQADETLTEAIAAFRSAELNKPQEGERFYIVMNKEGNNDIHENAWTYIFDETKTNDGEYNLQWLHKVNANYAQSLIFTATGVKNQYILSFTDENGTPRYICTQKGGGYDDNGQPSERTDRIRVTTDAEKALKMNVVPTAQNIWRLKSTEQDSFVGSNGDKGVFSSNNACDLTFVKAETAKIKCAMSRAGWRTLILPFNADVPEGITAYTCSETTASEGETSILALEEVTGMLKANTPYILSGNEGTFEFSGYGMATKDSYENGLLTGVFTNRTSTAGTYVLQNQEKYGTCFYKVVDVTPEITAYTAFLTKETTANVNTFAFILPGNETAIHSVAAENATVDVYNLHGILIRKNVKKNEALKGLTRGVYVINGIKKAVRQ